MLEKWKKGSSEPPHSHPGDDCTIVMQGTMRIQFFADGKPDGEPVTLTAGQTGYISANRVHSVE
jgi:quercetin dioxygenase-like cupin family protein